jgi:Reverse transcriptase (RNA-dependent DNA polymerase)
LWDNNEKLIIEQNTNLEVNFTIEKTKEVVFQADGNNSPGPDSLSFHFYQNKWDLVKDVIVLIVNAFYNHNLDLSKLNLASIILIPKKTICNSIHHFRPINLINCSCKIISKNLANRMTNIIDHLIDNTQIAFIKGRSIYDNIICAQEILHQVKISKIKEILLKVVFEKAFDNVNWDFLI